MHEGFKSYTIRILRKLAEVAASPIMNQIIGEMRRDLLGGQLLSSLPGPYIPYTRPALSTGAIATILNDILINQRCCVVECGGGASTIFIARLMRQAALTTELITIEQDEAWLTRLQGMLAREQLADYVNLVHAPLCPSETDHWFQSYWYDFQKVGSALDGKAIDLLIIDGPSSSKANPYARYTAVPFFGPFLSETNTIMLDDIRRRKEREIAAKWKEQFGISFKEVGAIGICSSGDQFKPFL